MPAKSAKQRKFMGADLARAKAGKKTKTGMNTAQLADFAKKPTAARGDKSIGQKSKQRSRSEKIGRYMVGQ